VADEIRVLHMIGSLGIGGSQACVMNLYRNIDRNAIQFDFAVDSPGNNYYVNEIENLGGKIYYFPKFNGKNIIEVQRAWNNFLSKHREYKILHSHVRSYASIYIPIAKRNGVKTIIHSHSTSNGRGFASVAKSILQYPLRYQADYFFGCSKAAGEWLFGKGVVKSNQYYTLQNAVDTRQYQANPKEREECRRRLGIENKKVFLHVGRLHPSKNHNFLLNVFAKVVNHQPDSILLIAGDGELRSGIEERIDELALNGAVKMLGSRSDIPELMQAADCFLFPSNWEGLPLAVVEAQAAGIPCLISDHVTREVQISELVTYLPIDQGVDLWVDAILKINYQRKNVICKIKRAGFDVQDTAKWLEVFYRGIIDE